MENEAILMYTGGKRFLAGVPARDLTQRDLDRLSVRGVTIDDLTATGLYEKARKKRTSKASPPAEPSETAEPDKNEAATTVLRGTAAVLTEKPVSEDIQDE